MLVREYSKTALALGGPTTFTVVADEQRTDITQLFTTLWKHLYAFERRCSRFIPGSELSVLNRKAGLRVKASSEFIEVLDTAKTISERTNGIFNPFILPALQRAGYTQSATKGYEQDIQEDYANRQVVSAENVTIGDNWVSIPYGTALDLGGCGKGYVADELAHIAHTCGVQGYWFSMSGDIVSGGLDADNQPISISIQSAQDITKYHTRTIVCPTEHYGVATSGSFNRPGQEARTKWHHIVDPKTLLPAKSGIKLATVCTNSGLFADALASCALILGSKQAPEFLERHGVDYALLQCQDARGKFFDIEIGKPPKHNQQTEAHKELQHA